MSVKAKHVKELLRKLSEHSGFSTSHDGFGRMSELIEEVEVSQKTKGKGVKRVKVMVSQSYLYRMYQEVKDAPDDQIRRYYLTQLDQIARTIGYKDYAAFIVEIDTEVGGKMRSYLGNWWSMVRANAGEYILKAPIRIFLNERGTEAHIEMQGGRLLFKGKADLRADNLFCELDSGIDKKFYIIMKVGAINSAKLLQGVFTGISSAGDPICGRELFIREEDLSFDRMKWEKLAIGKNDLDQRINQYFGKYEGNCIKANNMNTGSLRDLDPQ